MTVLYDQQGDFVLPFYGGYFVLGVFCPEGDYVLDSLSDACTDR